MYQIFRESFNLVTNPDSWNTPTNVFKCFVLLFLVKCLAHAGYFEESTDLDKDKSYIGKLVRSRLEMRIQRFSVLSL